MTDDMGTANLLHFASNRCKRVTHLVMDAEIHGLVLAFYYAYKIKHIIGELLNQYIALQSYIDSLTVFDVIANDVNSSERRLQIYIHVLRQAYEN